MKNKAVFIDRDGVINDLLETEEGTISPRVFEKFKIRNDVPDAIEIFKELRLKIVVVSNQPDISKGKMDENELRKMTEKMTRELRIDLFLFCPHHPKFSGECDCRKPKDGMLKKAQEELNIDIGNSYMIGDSSSDIEAGSKCKTKILIKGFYSSNPRKVEPDYFAGNLLEAAKIVEKLEGLK